MMRANRVCACRRGLKPTGYSGPLKGADRLRRRVFDRLVMLGGLLIPHVIARLATRQYR